LGEHLDAEVSGIGLAQRRRATSVKVSELCLGAEIAAMPSAEQRAPNWSNGRRRPREASLAKAP
jgi:hypothetical protein